MKRNDLPTYGLVQKNSSLRPNVWLLKTPPGFTHLINGMHNAIGCCDVTLGDRRITVCDHVATVTTHADKFTIQSLLLLLPERLGVEYSSTA